LRQYLQAGCFYYDLQAGRFFLKVTVFLLWAYGTAKFKTGREKYSDKIWFAVHGILKKAAINIPLPFANFYSRQCSGKGPLVFA
jgi:hypothetical protein